MAHFPLPCKGTAAPLFLYRMPFHKPNFRILLPSLIGLHAVRLYSPSTVETKQNVLHCLEKSL